MSGAGLIVIVATATVTAIVFTLYPGLDLAISAVFFDPDRRIFPAQGDGFLAGFRFVTSWTVAVAIAIPAISLIGTMSRPAMSPTSMSPETTPSLRRLSK